MSTTAQSYCSVPLGGPGRLGAAEEDQRQRGQTQGGHQHQPGAAGPRQRHLRPGGGEQGAEHPHPLQGEQALQAPPGLAGQVVHSRNCVATGTYLDSVLTLQSRVAETPAPVLFLHIFNSLL